MPETRADRVTYTLNAPLGRSRDARERAELN